MAAALVAAALLATTLGAAQAAIPPRAGKFLTRCLVPETTIGPQHRASTTSRIAMLTPDRARCARTHVTITVTSTRARRYAETNERVMISRSLQVKPAGSPVAPSYVAGCILNETVKLTRGSSGTYFIDGSAWTTDCVNIDICSKQAVGQQREVEPEQGTWTDAGSGPVNSPGCANELANYSNYSLRCAAGPKGYSLDYRTTGILTMVDTEGDTLHPPPGSSEPVGPYDLACG